MIWVDGDLVPATAAGTSATSRAVTLGVGVFETCKVVDRAVFALGRHLVRLRDAAERVGIPLTFDDESIRAGCAQVVDATTGRLRLTLTDVSEDGRDPDGRASTLAITFGPPRRWSPSAAVTTEVEHVINERSLTAGIKTTSHLEYVLAAAAAHERDADEAILVNTRDVLCEGTASNVFLVVDGALATPSLATGCLPGVTRALVTELVPVVERDDLTVEDLRRTPEAFLTSSTRDIQPLRLVDGQPIPACPGPHTDRAMHALAELQACTLDP